MSEKQTQSDPDTVNEEVIEQSGDINFLDLQNPLFRLFRERANPTCNHSKSVLSLVENICAGLDIDSTNLKLAALYHDIGKMWAPEFFTENQKSGTANPHDEIDAYISYLIITSHVTNSVSILLANDFPLQVIKIVGQHHGTNVLRAFYEKARVTNHDIPEDLFRYKTMKPTCLESMILMICDHVEATAKSIYFQQKKSADPATIINSIFNQLELDGQFDEVEIRRLGYLRKMKEALIEDIGSMYHQRAVYPEDEKLIIESVPESVLQGDQDEG